MSLVTLVAQSIVRDMALLPKGHEARTWYDTTLSTPPEVFVFGSTSTRSTLAAKPRHFSRQMRHFVPLELSTARQASPEKQTVRIWDWTEVVFLTIGPLTAQNRNNEEPLSVCGRSRGWEHSAPGYGQTTAHEGTHELTSPQSERRCFRTFLRSRVGSLVDAAALASHQGPA